MLCMTCGIKLSPIHSLRRETKFNRIIGWEGKCEECGEQTIVYSNADFLTNPKLKSDSTYHSPT